MYTTKIYPNIFVCFKYIKKKILVIGIKIVRLKCVKTFSDTDPENLK